MHSETKANAFLIIFNSRRVRDPVMANWALDKFFRLMYQNEKLAKLADSIILLNDEEEKDHEDVIQDILVEMLRIIRSQQGIKARELKSLLHFASKKFYRR